MAIDAKAEADEAEADSDTSVKPDGFSRRLGRDTRLLIGCQYFFSLLPAFRQLTPSGRFLPLPSPSIVDRQIYGWRTKFCLQ